MKKSIALLILSLIYITVNAQVVEKTYHFDEPKIVNVNGYSQIHFQGSKQYADVGFPSLPYHAVSLLLPMGCEAESVELQLLDFKEIDGKYLLYPYQQAIPYSHPEAFKFEKNDAIYASKGNYPERSHNEVTTHYLNGYSFAFLNFTPVQYVPSEGKVLYAQKVKVSVKTKSEREDHSSMLWNTPHILKSINNLAQNPEMISSYLARGKSNSNYDILVITGEDYVTGFDEYVNHYNSIGYRTKIATTEDIYSIMLGIDEQDKIRNHIIQEYQQYGISMVMLGGDVNIIPYRGFYSSVSEEYTDYNIPSDLYYAGLDGNWNSNDNDKWGEWFEADMLPELGVARLSFANAQEQANMIHKSLSYQREPVLGEFHNITLGSEYMDDTPTYGGVFIDRIIGECNDHGYTTVGIPEDYNFTRIYEENDNWSGANLAKTINYGTQYIHHAGHANADFVAGWYLQDITDENFSEVNGVDHNYTFFHSHGCICGAFDVDCILERMIKIENFCVAASGNSRYGWYCPGGYDGPATHLHRELVDAQYNEKLNNLAMSLRESRIQTAPAFGNDAANLWNFFDLNVLGDGAAPIWLDEPFETDIDCDSYLVMGSEKMELTVTNEKEEAMSRFRCSLYSEDDEFLGFALTDMNGNAEIRFDSPLYEAGYYKLIVTGYSAIPNVKEIDVFDSSSPYVVMDSYSIKDEDGQVDFSESHNLDISFKNIGNNTAGTVNATLTCNKPEYVNIITSTVNIGDVDANANIEIEDAFAFTVCDSVPDNTNIRFFVSCSDGSSVWESKFNMNINAPELEIIKPEGMILNPGDDATVEFTIINKGGSDANNVVFSIFLPEEINVNQDLFNIPNLAAGEEITIEVTLTVSDEAQYGYAYEMPVAVYSGRYITFDSYAISIGLVTEDFETGDFSKFDWEFDGLPTWKIVTDNVYEGEYCAKSTSIADQSTATIKIVVDVKAKNEISFCKKVSSEKNYDVFEFYIDSEMLGEWSGEIDWSEETYTIEEGVHTLRWVYSKDSSVSSGEDCAWLDNIVLPPVNTIVDVEVSEERDILIYPNPANDFVRLSMVNCQQSVVRIYNCLGMMVEEIKLDFDEIQINISDYNPGIYFINICNDEINFTEKIIVR